MDNLAMDDIEAASPTAARSPCRTRLLHTFTSVFPLFRAIRLKYPTHDNGESGSNDAYHIQIEDYQKGYPRFAALMAAHDCFHIFRRFSNLRVRLLLLAQDEIVQLEERLNDIDNREKSRLFLASRREDRNLERESIISQLHTCFAAYDDMLERGQRALVYAKPHRQYVSSLQSWLDGNSCIARSEASFLKSDDDLLTLSSNEDGVVRWLERTVCDRVMSYLSTKQRSKSSDPQVHIYPRTSTIKVARAIISPLIVFLLLTPVVICNSINSLNARLGIIIFSTAIFIWYMSLLTNARTVDLAVSGATYATVLIVFLGGTDGVPT